ncbi:MAG: HEAT repeat domain-containing protein [Pseudomonadota bacterium]
MNAEADVATRIVCIDALAKYPSPENTELLVAILTTDSRPMKRATINSLGEHGSDRALETVTSFFNHPATHPS